jgi:hypothetical protein
VLQGEEGHQHVADKQLKDGRLTFVTRSAILAASSSLKEASKTTITNSPPALCVVLSGGAGLEFVILNNSKESPWKNCS